MKRTKKKRKTRDGGRYSKGWKAWNKNNPNDPIIPGTGYVIHHKDEDPFNNHPSNLQKMTDTEHKKYHTSNGRHPNQGKKFSKELRNKLSEAHKGQKLTKGAKKKISKAMKGNQYAKGGPGFQGPHSMKTKQKISKANKGKTAWNKGKKMPKEYGQKISKALTGRKLSEEHKQSIKKGRWGEKDS